MCIFHSFLTDSFKRIFNVMVKEKVYNHSVLMGSPTRVASVSYKSSGDSAVFRKNRKQGAQLSQRSSSLQLCVSCWLEPLLLLVSEVRGDLNPYSLL